MDTETHTAENQPPEGAVLPPVDTGAPVAVAEPPAEPQPETSPAEEATAARMHRFSSYLHLGPGAETCDCIKTVVQNDSEVQIPDGTCENVEHVHVWVRMPNQFERKSLGEKAAAAAARRLRVLRDDDSDARAILEGELETVRVANDRDALLAEITGKHFLDDHLAAVKEVEEEDEEKWATIDEDRERLRALEEMEPESRPEEEFLELRKHLSEHTSLVNEARENIEAPRRATYDDTAIEGLIDIVREQRIENISNQARREEYAKWQWYTCTLNPKDPSKPGFPQDRYFASIDTFRQAPEELIEAIAGLTQVLEEEAQESLKTSLSRTHG